MRTLDCFRPNEVLDMNDMLNPNKMVEATHLTRAGRLTEATALLQRMLRDESGLDMKFGTAGDIVPRKRKPQTIDATVANDKTPRRPRFPRASTTLCIAVIAALGAESAAAQNCFLFFCQPGSQSQPSWQGTPTPEPDRQGEPGRPFSGGSDSPYSTVYAESNSEPFPVPALRLSDDGRACLGFYFPRSFAHRSRTAGRVSAVISASPAAFHNSAARSIISP
jgi:hypothetical protein